MEVRIDQKKRKWLGLELISFSISSVKAPPEELRRTGHLLRFCRQKQQPELLRLLSPKLYSDRAPEPAPYSISISTYQQLTDQASITCVTWYLCYWGTASAHDCKMQEDQADVHFQCSACNGCLHCTAIACRFTGTAGEIWVGSRSLSLM